MLTSCELQMGSAAADTSGSSRTHLQLTACQHSAPKVKHMVNTRQLASITVSLAGCNTHATCSSACYLLCSLCKAKLCTPSATLSVCFAGTSSLTHHLVCISTCHSSTTLPSMTKCLASSMDPVTYTAFNRQKALTLCSAHYAAQTAFAHMT